MKTSISFKTSLKQAASPRQNSLEDSSVSQISGDNHSKAMTKFFRKPKITPNPANEKRKKPDKDMSLSCLGSFKQSDKSNRIILDRTLQLTKSDANFKVFSRQNIQKVEKNLIIRNETKQNNYPQYVEFQKSNLIQKNVSINKYQRINSTYKKTDIKQQNVRFKTESFKQQGQISVKQLRQKYKNLLRQTQIKQKQKLIKQKQELIQQKQKQKKQKDEKKLIKLKEQQNEKLKMINKKLQNQNIELKNKIHLSQNNKQQKSTKKLQQLQIQIQSLSERLKFEQQCNIQLGRLADEQQKQIKQKNDTIQELERIICQLKKFQNQQQHIKDKNKNKNKNKAQNSIDKVKDFSSSMSTPNNNRQSLGSFRRSNNFSLTFNGFQNQISLSLMQQDINQIHELKDQIKYLKVQNDMLKKSKYDITKQNLQLKKHEQQNKILKDKIFQLNLKKMKHQDKLENKKGKKNNFGVSKKKKNQHDFDDSWSSDNESLDLSFSPQKYSLTAC